MTLKHLLALAAACFLFPSPVTGAILIGIVNDFQNSTVEGWSHGSPSPVPPEPVADAGPNGAGDHALRIFTTGVSFGAGSRYIAFNGNSNWQGDYLATGVTGIRVDINNIGSDALDLRVAINGPGGWFTSPAVIVAPGGGWHAELLSLLISDLSYVGGGTEEVEETLAEVSDIQLYSAADPDFGPGRIPRGDLREGGDALFDNITAVPEPTSTVLGSLSLCALLIFRSRARSSR